MRAITKPQSYTKIKFDLTAPIKPIFGLGGFSFTQTVKDFRGDLIEKNFESNPLDNFNYELHDKYFSMTIMSKNKEIEIEIDLLTGKINSMTCTKGYSGKMENEIGIGTSIKTALSKDKNLGFNLDTDWFDRTPFDGLIIYPPADLRDKCVDAACNGTDFPDFSIEVIELLDLDFAKEHFQDGQLIFE